MAKDNVLWNVERIRGELLMLGIRVTKRTVQKYMKQVRLPGKRGQSWSTFIRNHSRDIWACDFLQFSGVLFRPIFAFFFVAHGTTEVVHVHGFCEISGPSANPQPIRRGERRSGGFQKFVQDGRCCRTPPPAPSG